MKLNGKQILAGTNKYDAIIIGSGLSGAVCAHELAQSGKSVLVIEKMPHVGGNCYTERKDGIDIHKYGSHIFHTNDDYVWDWVNQFVEFNDYKHKVLAHTGKEVVMMPFTMVTFMQLFNVTTVKDAKDKIAHEIYDWFSTDYPEANGLINNFEDQAIAIVGTTIYKKLIKDYTEKQWGRPCTELPAEIVKRLPIRWNTDTTYFNNAKYQGIPKEGYTRIFERIFEIGSDRIDILHADFMELNEHFLSERLNENGVFVYTGELDRLMNYELGHLSYRSLEFATTKIFRDSYQGTAVVNFTDTSIWTRMTEHKWYSTDKEVHALPHTFITSEHSIEHVPEVTVPYYPINDSANNARHAEYVQLFKDLQSSGKFPQNSICIGRLAEYKYLDMDVTIRHALDAIKHYVVRDKPRPWEVRE